MSDDHPAWHAGAVALVSLREVGAVLRSMAEVARSAPLPEALPAPRLPPAVLVHGYLGHPRLLAPLAARLLDAGVPEVHRVAYPSTRIDLEGVIDAIAAVAEPLAREHGAVDLVGHSLGAFASRAWIKLYGGAAHVRRFVSLGGPHAGTSLHRLVPGPLRDAMRPRGRWVERVGEGDEPVPTTVIRARYDHQVFPPVRAAIPGVREVLIEGHGHNGLLFAREALDAVVAALTDREDATT